MGGQGAKIKGVVFCYVSSATTQRMRKNLNGRLDWIRRFSKLMSTLIAVGYVRRSAKKRKVADNTLSLQEQEKQIREYCQSHEMVLVRVVSHNGISGARRSRFDDINSAVTESGATALVVYNLDRLARDVGGLLDHIRGLALRGVAVHEVGQGEVDLKNYNKKLLVGVRGLMDEVYRDVISEKTTDVLRTKRELGLRYTNVPPLGYHYQDGKMVEEVEEQRALQVIAACCRNGFGARRIRHALINAGYAGRMSISMLHRIKMKLPAHLLGVGFTLQGDALSAPPCKKRICHGIFAPSISRNHAKRNGNQHVSATRFR